MFFHISMRIDCSFRVCMYKQFTHAVLVWTDGQRWANSKIARQQEMDVGSNYWRRDWHSVEGLELKLILPKTDFTETDQLSISFDHLLHAASCPLQSLWQIVRSLAGDVLERRGNFIVYSAAKLLFLPRWMSRIYFKKPSRKRIPAEKYLMAEEN